MAGKWCDEGENDVLRVYLKGDVSHRASLYLGLYTSPTSEPAEGATLADLTEPSGNGYSRIAMTDSDWSVSNDLATHAEKTFTATGPWGNVYGYFICTVNSGTSGLLLAVEQFSNGPYNVQNNGDQVRVTAKIRAA